MQTEIEAKFLGIKPENTRTILQKLGGKLVHPEHLMKRRVFDFPDKTLQKTGAWVRVRDEGEKVTLSLKQLINRTLHGTKELTIEVSDFETTCDFLARLGLRSHAYQETKRETWTLEDCEITIDTWPWIPTFLELEAPSEEKIKNLAEKLNLKWKDALHGSVETAYQAYYDVTEKEVVGWEKIIFEPIP